MFESISRRGFLGLGAGDSSGRACRHLPPRRRQPRRQRAERIRPRRLPPSFPAHDADVVKEIVGVSHGNLARVKELVSARPALARASWDWGYGDWETPIDAASHVGNRPIAEYLIANGARPTIFTAVMMGQLAIVKGWIEATPGVQRNARTARASRCWRHARAGGAAAAEVLKYLESLGDADPRYTDLPLTRGGAGGDRRRLCVRRRRDRAAEGGEERARLLTIQRARLLRAQPVPPGRPGLHSRRRRSREDPLRRRRRQGAVADRRRRRRRRRARRACSRLPGLPAPLP